MAYTESKAYDLRNVQYKGTRIGGTDQITICPVQYQGTPVTYVKYKNTNIMHRYVVWNGDTYDDEFTFDGDYYEESAGSYSVSSTEKWGEIRTNIPAPEPYSDQTIDCEYNITKYELIRTSGTKNESKYYVYAFTITLRRYDVYTGEYNKYRTDKYDYLSTDDLSLDTLAAQIEDPSGGTEGFTPPWKLGISMESILRNTRRERHRTDDVEYIGNFYDFKSIEDIDEGIPSSWGAEMDYAYYNGIFNQGAVGLTVDYYTDSSSSYPTTKIGDGSMFNFNSVVNTRSQTDNHYFYISKCRYTSHHSSCTVDSQIDSRHPIYVTDDYESRSSNDFIHFSLIFLLGSSCSSSALSNGDDKMKLTYYREDATMVHANISYDNYISRRDY